MIIYVNGAVWIKSARNYRPLTPAVTFTIGSKADGTLGFAGLIDDVRIFNVELSSTDIRDIYLDCPPLPNPMTWAMAPPRGRLDLCVHGGNSRNAS